MTDRSMTSFPFRVVGLVQRLLRRSGGPKLLLDLRSDPFGSIFEVF